jgi:hypothetical protein
VKITVKIDSKQKLTVLFVVPLRIEQDEVASAAGQYPVCGWRYPTSRVGERDSILIEKMVSKNHSKKSILNKNSPFFCVAALCKHTRAVDGGGGSKVCLWAAISRFTRSHQK